MNLLGRQIPTPFFFSPPHHENFVFDICRGSRVIFPNGAIDPWHALGVLETPMPSLPAVYVEGELFGPLQLSLPIAPAKTPSVRRVAGVSAGFTHCALTRPRVVEIDI